MNVMPLTIGQIPQVAKSSSRNIQPVFAGDINAVNATKVNHEIVQFSGPAKTFSQAFYKRLMQVKQLQKAMQTAGDNIRVLARTINPETGSFKIDILKIGGSVESLYADPTRPNLKHMAKEIALRIKKLSI